MGAYRGFLTVNGLGFKSLGFRVIFKARASLIVCSLGCGLWSVAGKDLLSTVVWFGFVVSMDFKRLVGLALVEPQLGHVNVHVKNHWDVLPGPANNSEPLLQARLQQFGARPPNGMALTADGKTCL